MKCPGCDVDVNYTETILRDILTRRIADPEIQLDLLGDRNQNMTLEWFFQFVETKESGKCSASHLLDSHAVETASSSYKKSKQIVTKQTYDICSCCGKKGHGKIAPAWLPQDRMPSIWSQMWTL